MGIGKFHHPSQLAGPMADAGQSPDSHQGLRPLPTLIPPHTLKDGSPQDSTRQAILVDLLCFLFDLGLIAILQILTGFPES